MGLDVLYLLIPASVALALVALGLFLWAIHSGQFDDLETPAIRILFDDTPAPLGHQAATAVPADASDLRQSGSDLSPAAATPQTRASE